MAYARVKESSSDMKKLPQGEELQDLSEKLGIPTEGIGGDGFSRNIVNDAELQRRIMEYR